MSDVKINLKVQATVDTGTTDLPNFDRVCSILFDFQWTEIRQFNSVTQSSEPAIERHKPCDTFVMFFRSDECYICCNIKLNRSKNPAFIGLDYSYRDGRPPVGFVVQTWKDQFVFGIIRNEDGDIFNNWTPMAEFDETLLLNVLNGK